MHLRVQVTRQGSGERMRVSMHVQMHADSMAWRRLTGMPYVRWFGANLGTLDLGPAAVSH